MGGVFTFSYNGGSQVQALVDQYRPPGDAFLGQEQQPDDPDALGKRTSYVYNAHGQIAASVKQLGNRSSMVCDSLGQTAAASSNGPADETTYITRSVSRCVYRTRWGT